MKYTEKQIRNNLWCFEQNGVRCFLFVGYPYSLLVDACFGGDLHAMCTQKTSTPIKLLLTHGDRDHTGCIDQFNAVYMHPAEIPHFEAKNRCNAYTLPIQEGDYFDIGTFCLEILHIPGHSPGSIALLEREKRFLIAGDSLQDGPIHMFGTGRDLTSYQDSLKRLLTMQNLFDVIYSSHYQLVIPHDIISELISLANDVTHNACLIPKEIPHPRPPALPSHIKLYAKNKAQFYL